MRFFRILLFTLAAGVLAGSATTVDAQVKIGVVDLQRAINETEDGRQAKRRLWRPGQTKKVFYYHILGNATVDKKIAAAIAKKREVVDYIVEGITGSTVKKLQSDAIATALGIFNAA